MYLFPVSAGALGRSFVKLTESFLVTWEPLKVFQVGLRGSL